MVYNVYDTTYVCSQDELDVTGLTSHENKTRNAGDARASMSVFPITR